MPKLIAIVALCVVSAGECLGQLGGSALYTQPGNRLTPAQNERAKRSMTREEMPPTGTSMFIEASVLMNVKADEYVAVFGIAQEGSTIAEAGQKMDAVVRKFTDELKTLGIPTNAFFVDFIAQNKIYAFEVTGEIAREKLAGFELKKNISIRYRDPGMLDRLMISAAQAQIFDLIKVDYLVKDTAAVQARLAEEAAKVIKRKIARNERLLGIKLKSSGHIYADRASIYYPTEMYESFTAQESENVNAGYYRQKYIIQGARKSRTFHFDPLTPAGFDSVINPVVIEPVVQFTHYLKLKYDAAAGK